MHGTNPADVDTLLDAAERYADKIRKMGSPEVKNFASAAVIFAVLIGGAIAVMILAGSDLGTFLPFLAKDAPVAAAPVVADVVTTPTVVDTVVEEATEIVGTLQPEPIESIEETVVVKQIDNSTSKVPQLWVKAD